jgi:hypothetical protein
MRTSTASVSFVGGLSGFAVRALEHAVALVNVVFSVALAQIIGNMEPEHASLPSPWPATCRINENFRKKPLFTVNYRGEREIQVLGVVLCTNSDLPVWRRFD